MKLAFEAKVREKIQDKPNLMPIFSDVHCIAERVNDYDDSFFIALNKITNKFEIHSLDYPEGNTISCTVPHDELDVRTLHHIYENDIRVHGKEIFRRVEQQEELARKRAEKEQKAFIQDMAKETQAMFAKDAWL